eukprot:TRINITY_DN246_c0_g1_i7.p3 TRINITY_DN246_c0_g1~~TRINITY_DN246_c0_g1_i7.p3  ORF type:complete len:181 (+),score=21.53 TRINITY_DN246_c0_g1_i7:2632-3174(+)
MGDKRSIANITKSDQKFALLAWPILVEMAESSKTTTYKALAQKIDNRHPKANAITGGEHHQVNRWMHCIHRMLRHIDKTIPPIGLLVKTTTGEFGQGLAKTLDDPNKTLQDIYKYPWHKVDFQIFPKVVDSFIGKNALKKQKDKAQKTEKERLENLPGLAEEKLDTYLNGHDTISISNGF